ncbi:MAG: hypothetical protein AB1758_09560 [Candidatus Eremiobacterota bacterium]
MTSPLWMVTQEPALTRLVGYLSREKDAIMEAGRHRLRFSRQELEEARVAFGRMIRRGEEKLHRLCELLSETFLGSCDLQSVVVGELPATGERFTITHAIASSDLYSQTDLDLGTRALARFRVHDGRQWAEPDLVANFVEYLPTEPNDLDIHKFISRIKAEEEIWNKVVDEIFSLDALVRRDKKLRHLSRFVKDVFGLKAVVGDDPKRAHTLQKALRGLTWSPEVLRKHRVPAEEGTERLRFVEVKNYLSSERKLSGWAALKSVVTWWDGVFEIQVQALGSYHRERERLTRESHTSFKFSRERLRNQIAEEMPLFGFYRDLLRWLFLEPGEPPPLFPGVEIEVGD